MFRTLPLLVAGILLISSTELSAAVRGVVIDRIRNTAVSGATVGIRETRQIEVSDRNGRVLLDMNTGDRYTIVVDTPGYNKSVQIVQSADPGAILKIYISPRLFNENEIVVTAKKNKPHTSRRTIHREELRRVPGSGGDIMRTIQALPGVATANDISGELFVRGNGPYDNRILVDKFWISRAYHFGGFVSVINTDVIDSIDFYSGGFPAQYGEATGSVLDIHSRDTVSPVPSVKLNVNLLTADAVVEGPVGENGFFIFSGRRSYFDLYAERVIEENRDVDVTALPFFWDYQGKLGYRFSRNNVVSLLMYGSGDRMGLVVNDSEDEDPDFANRKFNYNMFFHGIGFTWAYSNGRGFISKLKAGTYTETQRLYFGEYLDVDLALKGGMVREDVSLQISDMFDIDFGADYVYAVIDLTAVAPVVKQYAPQNPVFPEDYTFEELRMNGLGYHHVSGYLQGTLTVWSIAWVLGGRFDVHKDINSFHYLSPRSSVELTIDRKNRISFATGLYQQVHDMYFTNDTFGNPGLTTQKAVHYVLGYSHDFHTDVTLTIEGYYKKLWDLVVAGGEQTFDDAGTGRVYGGEIFLQRKLSRDFFGWVSYGYSVSQRDDHDGQGEYRFNYDRTHIVNVILSCRIVSWFQAGVKWRYATGLPVTKIIGSRYDADQGEYFPIYSSDYNGDRLPAYHKLDIRFDFFADMGGAKWNFYIEFLNAYNSPNVYDRSFNQRQPYSGDNPSDIQDLPFLPYLGIEVRF